MDPPTNFLQTLPLFLQASRINNILAFRIVTFFWILVFF